MSSRVVLVCLTRSLVLISFNSPQMSFKFLLDGLCRKARMPRCYSLTLRPIICETFSTSCVSSSVARNESMRAIRCLLPEQRLNYSNLLLRSPRFSSHGIPSTSAFLVQRCFSVKLRHRFVQLHYCLLTHLRPLAFHVGFSPPAAPPLSDLSMEQYHRLSDETLDSLLDYLEGVIDEEGTPENGWEIEYQVRGLPWEKAL